MLMRSARVHFLDAVTCWYCKMVMEFMEEYWFTGKWRQTCRECLLKGLLTLPDDRETKG